MNGSIVTSDHSSDSLTLRAVVEAPFLKDTEKLETLFLAAFSRLPRADERDSSSNWCGQAQRPGGPAAAYANIFGLCSNSPEFVLCP